MQRVDSKDNVSALPALTEAGNSPGYFSDGDQANEKPGTVVPAWWLNMVQEELCAVIEGADVALQKNARNQLLAAIKKILESSNFAEMAKEAKDAAVTAGTTAGNAAERAAQAKSIADALKILVEQSWADVNIALSSANTARDYANILLTYQEMTDAVDLDALYQGPGRYYLTSGEDSHLPDNIPAGPYFLVVGINDSGSVAEQVIYDAGTSREFTRKAAVDYGDPENVVVAWTGWANVNVRDIGLSLDPDTGRLTLTDDDGEELGHVDLPVDKHLKSADAVVDPDGQPAGKYLKLVFATETGDNTVYLDVTHLVPVYEAGNGIEIKDNAVSVKIKSGSGLEKTADGLGFAAGYRAMTTAQAAKLDGMPSSLSIKRDTIRVTSAMGAVAEGSLLTVGSYVVGSKNLLLFHNNVLCEPGSGADDQYEEIGTTGNNSTQIKIGFDVPVGSIITYVIIG